MKNWLLILALATGFGSLSAAPTSQEKIREIERSIINLKEELLLAKEDSYDMTPGMVDLDLGFEGDYVSHMINFVPLCGFNTQYTNQEGRNSAFGGTWIPGVLFRYGHEWLFHGSWLFTWFNQDAIKTWLNAWVAYFPCECINIRAGHFAIPFGIYVPNVIAGWIKKLPSDPIIREPTNPIVPSGVWGAQFQYTYDLCCWGGCFRQAWLTWDTWIDNGVSQESNVLDITGVQGNFDNNRDKSLGCRAGLWIDPSKSVRLSFLRSRWNNNANGFGFSIPTHLYYWAACADISWIFCDYYQILGEYIYSEHKALNGDHISNHGYWLELSAYLGFLTECMCLTECMADMLEHLQVVVRGSSVWSDTPNLTRHQVSVGGSYYFNNITALRVGYDFHWGNPGFDNNRLIISCTIDY